MVNPALFARFVPLDSLGTGNRDKLAQRLHLRPAAAGEILFRIGDHPSPTLYLVQGTVQLEDDSDRRIAICGGELATRHPLAPAPFRQVEARCLTRCSLLPIDPDLLDVMLTWDQGHALEIGEHQKVDSEDQDWMIRLLQMPIFQRVAPANLYAMFRRFKAISAEPGEALVQQGDEGDYFYVVVEGRCSVTRRDAGGGPIVLAELEAGACFGEEALISDEPRNATVHMLTPGRLMRLAKSDFNSLLNDPQARTIGSAEALALIAAGKAKWLDVRLPAEYRNGSLPESVNLPLHLLRLKLAKLDKKMAYVTVCDTGRRSSVAAWLLNQHGFEACRLDSGLPAGD